MVKVHSRCDLACDHCYVYQHADQSWAARPKVMADATITTTARRISEHAAAHGLDEVHVVLHGGEPLLAGRERLRRVSEELRHALAGVCRLDLRMQTNGLLLDDAYCAMLAQEDIRTGISLDGDRTSNDRHRRRADGSGSYDAVVRATRLLGSPPYRSAFAGLLCTIDIANDPTAVYEALIALDPPRIDFLLPHATWDHPPPRPAGDDGATAYARWLMTIYDRWLLDGCRPPVRLFDSIEATANGLASFTEALGLGSPDLVVVETDGEIEQADWLKTVARGAPATGFHIDRHAFDEAARHPGFLARHAGPAGLSGQCRRCPVVQVCGGGLYGHRHRHGRGFDNPSVFCADLFALIGHVRRTPRSARSRPTEAPAPPVHVLTGDDYDALAAGRGDERAVRALLATELSTRRVLLDAVRERIGDAADPALSVLIELAETSAHTVPGVLSQPCFRAWAVRCLTDPSATPALAGARLAEMALAAAVRAGGSARLTVALRGGSAHLPSLGRLVAQDAVAADLEVRGGELFVHTGGAAYAVREPPDGMRWEPLRYLHFTGRPVAVEDMDPFRDVYRAPARPRLTDDEFDRWRSALTAAWHVVGTRHAPYAVATAAVLTALTPLDDPEGNGLAHVDDHVFGVLGLALAPDAEALASLLVDGARRLTTNALLECYAPAAGPRS
ncbi:FxsB family cyclophane-forming radical SAM/SPASM peptide maturase [Streptomyces sp. SPB162]|uniref:FxsB family cyclophane-forming radical SAM/SPASM peptide maturase n=1 Tax=Streptomyces sp. SPB162 TaxID=2940560 RepID=UPI0024049324|nr:FxsB family cyclophane-forming radical SAM/SPASM peptide maturase [Streptomyces sp. SPB162]